MPTVSVCFKPDKVRGVLIGGLIHELRRSIQAGFSVPAIPELVVLEEDVEVRADPIGEFYLQPHDVCISIWLWDHESRRETLETVIPYIRDNVERKLGASGRDPSYCLEITLIDREKTAFVERKEQTTSS